MKTPITNQQAPATVLSYLNKYGSMNWSLETGVQKKYSNLIVVPAIQEFGNIKMLVNSLTHNDKKYFDETLVVFVVNNLRNSTVEAREDNHKSLEWLRKIISVGNGGELNIGLVDASSEGLELPEKDGGVGLARKIGMDLAMMQFDYSNKKKKILICLDADCTVSNNYLASIVQSFNQSNIHAAYVEYEHLLPENEKEKLAIICYEIFLRYYVLGLKYADSPFAFPTIGSTIACDYESYINIGGMNKKKAAEDFYFMEKLAKITKIKKIDSAKVYPSSRASWRVPFGTGQRVNRFFAGSHNEYVLYDPQSFSVLKEWLLVFNSGNILTAEDYLDKAKSIHASLQNFLIKNSFKKDWERIVENSKTPEQIQKQKRIWFDGFRTLKLIHYLRDSGFPLVNMFDALDEQLRIENVELRIERNEPIPSIEIQIQYLNNLRKLT